MSLYHSYDKHKQLNKQTIGFKSGTSWSQVEHSTTEPMGKEGMVHKFDSLVNAKTSMHM